jgi:hypothetical protein
MPQYNMGQFAVTGFDHVAVYNSLPDINGFTQIVLGGGFS